jgi:site-specific recombinase XerD
MLPYHAVARLAEINKPASLHSLRHSFVDCALCRRGLCSPFSS